MKGGEGKEERKGISKRGRRERKYIGKTDNKKPNGL